ncbi:TPA: hypothetical protein HA361_04745 [Candidatus Woesearchaeota archaeon]|nr:hypothetical protein [Candidatus Woesearchaeota archaeon]
MQCTTEFSRAISPQAGGGTKLRRSEAKEAVGNARFKECFLGMMPFVITKRQAGSWKRGIP